VPPPRIVAAALAAGAALSAPQAATLQAGNGAYRIFIGNAGSPAACGSWTARTGTLHPLGANQSLLFGSSPVSSYTTLRSHANQRDYTTSDVLDCTTLCSVATPLVEQVLHEGVKVGYRFTWSFVDDPGPAIELIQEVVVEGPVDGNETEHNSAVRETHTVKNLGPGAFSFGLRKMWDWAVGGDDGPWLADCAAPEAACDRSMNLTRDGAGDGAYPASYAMTNDPQTAACPRGTHPNEPQGCGGAPAYVVAGTVRGRLGDALPPTPPALVQFSAWANLFGTCWLPAPADSTACGTQGFPDDDNALAYFYGVSPQRPVRLQPGETRSFTQYLGAAATSCPAPIAPR